MSTETERKNSTGVGDPSLPEGIHGTVIPGAPPGYTRVAMTLTPEQVESLKARGFVVRKVGEPGDGV